MKIHHLSGGESQIAERFLTIRTTPAPLAPLCTVFLHYLALSALVFDF